MFSIAAITFLRLREAAYWSLLAIGIALAYFLAGLGTFHSDIAGEEVLFGEMLERPPVLLGTILLTLLATLITIFNAAAELPRDIGSRMIAILLSKPISRHRYLWGKFLGTVLLGWLFGAIWITAMLLFRTGFIAVEGDSLSLIDGLRQFACLLILLPVAAIAVGISCYFGDIIAMIVTSVYTTLCFVAALFPVVIALLGGLWIGRALLVPYYLFPNLVYFLRSYSDPLGYAGLLVYAAALAVLFISGGRLRFERGDVF